MMGERNAIGEAAPNPFFETWGTPFGMPPFERIETAHFEPAFDEGIARQRREVEAVATHAEAPTFESTVAALDASGSLLDRIAGVFFNLTAAETSETLQDVARSVAPRLTALEDDIRLDPRLFARVRAVWERRDALGLDVEQMRLVEETYKAFVRGGANLAADAQARLREINEELSVLSLRFADNVLEETNAYRLVVDEADLSGLPANVVAAAADAARAAGLAGKWVFTLHAPSLWPFLTYADNRALRRELLEAYLQRADRGNRHDNKAVLTRIAALRAERAKLLGYASHAHFVLEERMAKTPERVYDLLERLWAPARAVAATEAADLQAAIEADGHTFRLEPWDWRYYAEKVKRARYDLDENALRPYFTLENVREGAFYVANRLYGLTFEERTDLPKYHEEARTFEVKDADGSHLGVFVVDFYPRPGKRAGAWSSAYRRQHVRDGVEVRPVVVNVCNFTRPVAGQPALLRLDEVETLFHEFGHALHALLARIRYRSLASVPRDFVELPSQILEHWATEPEVLAVYARHWQTDAPIPADLVERIRRAERFNQGFATVEYLAASYLDLDWHTVDWHTHAGDAVADAGAFERAALERIGVPPEVGVRYRSTYFQHVFSGGYSAGYYSYIWSEVLDTDAYEAFKQHGLFDPETARAFRTCILEKGGTADADAMYRAFRGREPSVEPLLAKRGLLPGGARAEMPPPAVGA